MTRQELLDKYRHQFGGLLADAYTTDAKGGELSIRMRSAFRTIDNLIAQMHHDMNPPASAPSNGAGKPNLKVGA